MPHRSQALFLLLLPALLSLSWLAQAQEVPADTLAADKPLLQTDAFEEMQIDPADSAGLPDPRKAAFLSAVLPGMGQAYNGSLWKVPLIYIGGISFIKAVDFNNVRYSESLRNLRTVLYGLDVSAEERLLEGRYRREVEFYRRNRDYMIILGGAFYGLHIVEAYVDAHLQTFDMDEDLSMRIRPTLIPDPSGTLVAGVRITYTFP